MAKLTCEGVVEARKSGKTELVVAACGPEALVEAVKRAVAASAKKTEGLTLHFAGAESHW